MPTQTPITWVAYKVYKLNYCNPDEVIGYYQTKDSAEQAKLDWIANPKNNVSNTGICCNNSKDVLVEEIIIMP